MSKIRIKDIAEQAGVSPATVSRVLNNRPGSMTEETRLRVEEVIRRTGYRPSSAARSLRAGKSGALGVILADIRNPFSSAMLEELSSVAAQRGYSLVTATSSNDPAHEIEAIERLVAAGVDGLILNTCRSAPKVNSCAVGEKGQAPYQHAGMQSSQTHPANAELDEKIAWASKRVPMVLLDRDVPASGLPLVTSNNGALVNGLVNDLAATGCRRAYMLDENHDTSVVRRERGNAFLASTSQRGLEGAVIPLVKDVARAASLLKALVRRHEESSRDSEGPVGLIAVNGLVFLRLVEALASADITCPQEVKVATFDEYAWNRVVFGGVTTAVQDTHALAIAALDLALDERGNERGADQDKMGDNGRARIEVPGSIMYRASTAA